MPPPPMPCAHPPLKLAPRLFCFARFASPPRHPWRLDARRFQQLVLERMRTVAHDAGRWTSRTPPPAYELLCLEVNQICEPIGRVNILQWLNRIAEFDIPLADEGRELEWWHRSLNWHNNTITKSSPEKPKGLAQNWCLLSRLSGGWFMDLLERQMNSIKPLWCS